MSSRITSTERDYRRIARQLAVNARRDLTKLDDSTVDPMLREAAAIKLRTRRLPPPGWFDQQVQLRSS